MKKKVLFGIPIIAIFLGLLLYFTFDSTKNNEIMVLRAQHQQYLDNSPFKETLKLSKMERRSLGLPPNKYFERMYELTMNPALGHPEPNKVIELQKLLNDPEINSEYRVPGDAGDNLWVERGPNNVGGRARVVFFDPNDGTNSRVFAGGVSGGLWVTNDITTNGGWTRVAGVPGNLNVSCYAIDPNNSNIWYIGTGEQYTFGQAVGNGVYKTTDGGVTWTNVTIQLAGVGDLSTSSTLFLAGNFFINDILARDNGGSTELYVAIGAHYYGDANNQNNLLGTQTAGLYRSTDNGANWTRNESALFKFVFSGFDFFYIPSDLELASDNTLWMGTMNTPGLSIAGGGGVFSSSDGLTWTSKYQVTNGLRTELETSASSAGKIYVLSQINGGVPQMYVTTDAFATAPTAITLPNDPDTSVPANDFTRNQSGYDLVVEADPTNDATVFIGGINLHRSTDSGGTWNTISHWATFYSTAGSLVHADQHALTFRPGNSNQAALGHDGGISFASDLSTTGNNLTDIIPVDDDFNVTQFYHMGVSPTAFNSNSFLGGTQDNGTPYFSGTSTTGPDGQLFDISGGDGAYSFFDQVATDYMLFNYVYNQSVVLYDFSVGAYRTVASNSDFDGDFINPQALDSNLDLLYSNGTNSTNGVQLYRYNNLTNLPDPFVTSDRDTLSNASLNANITALAVSPFNATNTDLLVGLETGKLLKVNNAEGTPGTETWSDITDGSFVGSTSDVEFGQTVNDIFVTFHNYGVSSIWYSSDGGSNWAAKEGNLPDIPVKCIMQNPINTEEVIVGTELGVWRTQDFSSTTPTWIQSYNGMSDVKVTDLQLRDDNTIFASTFGRGIFSGPFTGGTLATRDLVFANGVNLYPSVSDGLINIKSSQNFGNTRLDIFSINGQKVYSSQLELSPNRIEALNLNLASGLYLVKLITEDNISATKKIVIK
jgi:photosystem II stability/assembly factor-like uncharacterized protein